jgi:hypothetical protein
MTFEELEEFVQQEPKLADTLKTAASAAASKSGRLRGTFDPLSTMALTTALVFAYPILKGIVARIGLPWVRSAANYSELWRMRFDRWVDKQHEKHGFDPDASKAESEALLSQFEQTTDTATREAWERLLSLLRKGQPKDQPDEPVSP